MALVLFAVSDDLIYYSSELKPYSVDLAVGLVFNLMAIEALGKPITFRRGGDAGHRGHRRPVAVVCLGVCCRRLRRDLDPRQSACATSARRSDLLS